MANNKTTNKTQAKEKEKVQVKTPTIKAQIDRMVNYEGSKVKAYASATIGGAFAVHNMRVMESENGLYVAMPSRSYEKNGKTEYSDTFHAITSEGRAELNQAVLDAYDQELKQEQEDGEEQGEDKDEDIAPTEPKM